VSENFARGFLLPDGVLPRMRLLAWGWEKPGDKFKSPSDASWWKRRYQFPLWAPLETYLDQVARQGHEPPVLQWDDDLAAGDPAELSRSLPSVVQYDLTAVSEAPCPKWIIPPSRGMLPIPNPKCFEKPVREVIDKLRPQSGGFPWWIIVVGLLLSKRSR